MTWSDISLYKYNQIKDIISDTSEDDETRTMQLIQIIFNVNPYIISMQEFRVYLSGLSFIHDKIPKMKIKDKYVLNGNEYSLYQGVEKFNVAQWIDFQNIIKNNEISTDIYPEVLSVFFIPVGKEYGEDYDIMQVKKDIDQYLSIPDAMVIATFFLTFQKRLLEQILQFTKQKMLQMKTITKAEKRRIKKEVRKTIKQMYLG